MDQSLFAAPHGLSQRITSFIACACQGIHQLPLFHLIVLIANAHPCVRFGMPVLIALVALKGHRNQAIPRSERLPFTTQSIHDAINVFDRSAHIGARRCTCRVIS